ncbi:MAG: glycine zipper 2TM domain-containing protein [Paraglaciecola sp.]|uniref:glycine zipper 2TM domain-containing protein n=1 Tax=Paraglaciecola sp. TaxID=1920173 RepID=UPI00329991DB
MKTIFSITLLLMALSPLAHAKSHHTIKAVKISPTHKYHQVKQQKYVKVKTNTISKNNPRTGVKIGGLIGGVIGHNASTGRDKILSTVAGVIIGSTIGHQVEKLTSTHKANVYRKVIHKKPHH